MFFFSLISLTNSSTLALRACQRHQLSRTLLVLFLLKLLTGYLIYNPTNKGNNNNNQKKKRYFTFGDPIDAVDKSKVREGLYYQKTNDRIQSIVDAWPEESWTYSKNLGATPWMPTGDSRTGLPFILNKVKQTEPSIDAR